MSSTEPRTASYGRRVARRRSSVARGRVGATRHEKRERSECNDVTCTAPGHILAGVLLHQPVSGATMSDRELQCPKCGKRMEPGYVLDVTHGAMTQSSWIEGAPERSFWTGLKLK